MRSLSFLIVVASALLAGCNDSSSERVGSTKASVKKTRIELASFAPTSVNVIGEQIAWIADELEKVSGGNIELEVFDPGALVGSLEILPAVSEGKVDAGYGAAGFWIGMIPASPIFTSVPFGPDSSEFLAWLFQGNGMDLYQEMYDQAGFNVKVLVCSMIPPESSGWFAKEITGPQDLNNLKMRFFGLGGQVMGKLGVSVSVPPVGEIFPSLEKGVLDATEYALPSVDASQGFYKVVKYNYFPGWHQQSSAFELLINKDVWNRLSASQQAQIETVCKAAIVHSIAYSEGIQAEAIRTNIDQHGVNVKMWSPEMLDLFRTTWEEVAEEQASKDTFFKKVWEDLKAFRAEYATWSNRAYIR